jgi:hypothetical protein
VYLALPCSKLVPGCGIRPSVLETKPPSVS